MSGGAVERWSGGTVMSSEDCVIPSDRRRCAPPLDCERCAEFVVHRMTRRRDRDAAREVLGLACSATADVEGREIDEIDHHRGLEIHCAAKMTLGVLFVRTWKTIRATSDDSQHRRDTQH